MTAVAQWRPEQGDFANLRLDPAYRSGRALLPGGRFAVYYKRVAGAAPVLVRGARALPTAAANSRDTLRLVALASGEYAVWLYRGERPGEPLISGTDAALVTGAALDDGKAGIFDWHPSATAVTRTFDDFAAWAPEPDAVLYPSGDAELSSDGYSRQSSDGGSASAPIVIQGDLPRMPASGQEGRKVEIFLETSRGDLDQLPDSGLDTLAARVLHRPSYLFPPRS